MDIVAIIGSDEWVDPISEEQEAGLIVKAQAGDEDAILALLKQYSPALKRAMRNIGEVDPQDAAQEALAAMINVIKTHDVEKEPRLVKRIPLTISSAVGEAGRRQQSQFSIPAGTVKRYNQILRAAGGDKEKATTLCSTYKMKVSTFLHIHNLINHVDVIEEVGHFPGGPLDDTVSDSLLCEYAFTVLDEEQEQIIRAGYGFNEVNVDGHLVWCEGHTPLSATIVAAAMDISTARVKKKHSEALNGMRVALTGRSLANA